MMGYRIFLILLVVLYSCGNSESGIESYLALLHDEQNGYRKQLDLGDLTLEMKLIPAEYSAFIEAKGAVQKFSNRQMDSLVKTYEPNLNFILKIGPSENTKDKFDITSVGVSSYDEFNERSKTLNFLMKEKLTLTDGKRSWTASICEMENVYSLSFHRVFNIVFTPQKDLSELKDLNTFRIIYDDELFGLGRNTFSFSREKMQELPTINKLKI